MAAFSSSMGVQWDDEREVAMVGLDDDDADEEEEGAVVEERAGGKGIEEDEDEVVEESVDPTECGLVVEVGPPEILALGVFSPSSRSTVRLGREKFGFVSWVWDREAVVVVAVRADMMMDCLLGLLLLLLLLGDDDDGPAVNGNEVGLEEADDLEGADGDGDAPL
ncbi:hypothetical protein DL93DRAFT_2093325 [Clavulina sp. PMI_390]|nr:hypothetical protein DL93DRAFT_2093325 [Clavulina sp. PMI_390]